MKHYFLSLLALLLVVGGVATLSAQERIDVGAELWVEPSQTEAEVESWIKTMADSKMRSARVFLMWNYIETAPKVYDFHLYDALFRAAEKYGVEIEATLFCTHAPVFYCKKYGYSSQRHVLYYSQEIKALSNDFVRECVVRYRDSKALGSWWILNEARSFKPLDPYTIEFTQNWLCNKYGTIEALNKEWITDFKSFDEIKYDPVWESNKAFVWNPAHRDWIDISRDILTHTFAEITKVVRQYDPKTPITSNPADFFGSLDRYDLATLRGVFDIFGASMHAAWQLRTMSRDKYAYSTAGICEILRAHAPNNRFWVGEMQAGNNIFSGRTPICPTRDDLAQWVWTGIGTGARKVIYWSANYRRQSGEAGEWGVFGFKGEATDRSLVTKEINEVIEQNNDFFKSSKPELSNITLILSPETQRMLRHIRTEKVGVPETDPKSQVFTTFHWFEALSERGYQPQMRYFTDYEWEKRGEGDVVIVANAFAVPSSVVPRMVEFVKRGGKVVLEGLVGFYNENEVCTSLSQFDLEPLVGGVYEDIRYRETPQYFEIEGIGKVLGHAWHPILRATAPTARVIGEGAEGAVALHNKLGKGEVYWIAPSVSMSQLKKGESGELSHLADALLSEQLAKQPFHFAGHANGALLRVLRSGNEYVTIVTNNLATDCQLKLVAPKGMTATPIFGTAKFSKSGKITLGCRETLVLRWK
ncbi:MAG: beta-galactosidase [Alistipes sp.]|nr:beta-galactosidase [Alistipes sp.]